MSAEIVKTLRERAFRYGAEANDQMQIRRQKEREDGADEIERLRAIIRAFETGPQDTSPDHHLAETETTQIKS